MSVSLLGGSVLDAAELRDDVPRVQANPFRSTAEAELQDYTLIGLVYFGLVTAIFAVCLVDLQGY